MIEDWVKDDHGNIVMFPMIGYELLTSNLGVPRISVRLDFAKPGDPLQAPTGNLQLVLEPQSALQFAKALGMAALKATTESLDMENRQNLL
jgi:hypothetical protein